jgi:hypothetical protein
MSNRYFRGQGTVKIATRTGAGAAETFRSIGNCPRLAIEASEDFFEHWESESGDRRQDIRIRTSLKVTVNFTIENLNKANLMMAFHGADGAAPPSGQEVVEAFKATPVHYWLLFEGLNTLENKDPFNVNIFKVRLSVPSAFELISDELTQLEIEGAVLYDSLNSSKGGYFTVAQKLPPA